MSSALTLAPDAAIVLGLASTAMPFARTPGEAVERWLRALRSNGQAGVVLQSLGVSEGATEVSEGPDGRVEVDRREAPSDAVARVAERAAQLARERGAGGIATTDLLRAVMCVYGPDFDRVLRAHGTDRHQLITRLSAC
ncbi:MAG: hypothetical protein WB998_06600 [Solirubrobacteraceae bacterium]